MFTPGIRKRDGLEVMLTEFGASRGWGKGEISGMMNNFKSVSAVFAPTIFAKSYVGLPPFEILFMLFCIQFIQIWPR